MHYRALHIKCTAISIPTAIKNVYSGPFQVEDILNRISSRNAHLKMWIFVFCGNFSRKLNSSYLTKLSRQQLNNLGVVPLCCSSGNAYSTELHWTQSKLDLSIAYACEQLWRIDLKDLQIFLHSQQSMPIKFLIGGNYTSADDFMPYSVTKKVV